MMSVQSVAKRLVAYVLRVCLGVTVGMLLAGRGPVTVSASSTDMVRRVAEAQGTDVEPAAQWVSCVPENAAVYTNRVHVKCTTATLGIWYYAAPTSNSKNAARLLNVLLTAKAAGQILDVLTDATDPSGTAYNCAASDCRPLLGVAIH